MLIYNYIKELEGLQKGISNIKEYEVTKDSLESICKLFLINLEQEFSKLSINGSTIEYLSKYSICDRGAKFTIRTKLKDNNTYSKTVLLSEDDTDFYKIIKAESYDILKNIYMSHLAEYYVKELNTELVKINRLCDVELYFSISWNTIVDICNTYVIVGLTVEQALEIPKLLLFDCFNGIIYKKKIREQLRICQTPAQVIKYKNTLLKDLGVYTRSRFELLLRDTYTRKYQYMGKNSVGYILQEGIIALIESSEGNERLKLSPIDLSNYLYADLDLGF